jgi:hypothetical protein
MASAVHRARIHRTALLGTDERMALVAAFGAGTKRRKLEIVALQLRPIGRSFIEFVRHFAPFA